MCVLWNNGARVFRITNAAQPRHAFIETVFRFISRFRKSRRLPSTTVPVFKAVKLQRAMSRRRAGGSFAEFAGQISNVKRLCLARSARRGTEEFVIPDRFRIRRYDLVSE